MRNKLLYIFFMALCNTAICQSGGGLEHYYYVNNQSAPAMVPIIHYNTSANWYGEARYNYEDFNTLSLYGGKTFSKEGRWSWSATPLVGGMMGSMNGGSFGINFDLGHKNIFLSSQSQYSFSLEDRLNKYFFTWSEIGYQARSWCYAGIALQQTTIHKESGLWETGCVLGFSFGKWTVPIYAFNISKKDKYFILGVNWEWLNKQKQPQTIVYE